MQESQAVFDQYSARLHSIDALYARLYGMSSYRLRFAGTSWVGERVEMLKTYMGSRRELGEQISQRVGELVDTLSTLSQTLANMRREVAENIGNRINELSGVLQALSEGRTEFGRVALQRIAELKKTVDKVFVPKDRIIE